MADVQQLFDLADNPTDKQKLLSGAVNVAHCPNCGFEGQLATPLVYHDPEKELLLTFFPSEMGMAMGDQERVLGPMIKQVVDRLPQEKRKAYLLQPKAMLTYQTLVEKILEADGITKEMIEAQQKKINLIQQLLNMSAENRIAEIKKEEPNIDETVFSLLARLTEASLAQGDKATGQQLAALQKDLMENTVLGGKIKEQAQEVQAAIKSLQDAGKDGLTREKLLDLLIQAPTDIRLSTLVSYARSGMDYSFFQMLTERIEHAQGDEKQKLMDLRTKLLDLTSQIDKQIDEELKAARQLLEKIIAAPDVEKEAENSLGEIDQFFGQVLETAIADARQRGDVERSTRLQKLVAVIEKASAPPPEFEFIEQLLSAKDDAELNTLIAQNSAKITSQFLQVLNSVVAQSGESQEPEVTKRLQTVYSAVMRHSMQQNLKK
jgi:hypothetical protein